MDERWRPLELGEVAQRFRPFDVPWWIAGGWAIDCFLGWRTREHVDVDVEMFRSDREILFNVFDGWELFTVSGGVWAPWRRGMPITDDVFGIWGRPSPQDPWGVEVILADGDSSLWRFRRDRSITLAGGDLIAYTESGIPYCTPEVQLLYKSKQARPKDDVDLTRTLWHMSRSQRRWLADAIRRGDPGHPWIGVLEAVDALHHE